MASPGPSPEDVRAALHRTADWIADYLEGSERYPVLPPVEPGDVAAAIPDEAPEEPESLERILDDYERLIAPAMTQWNHPGFMAYFVLSGIGPGVVGEALASALNVNAMLWKSGPAPTELEIKTCDWLRHLFGLPEGFFGHLTDTASSSTLVALTAARHRARPEIRQRGLADPEQKPLVLYTSDQAHSSIDKDAIVLGLGLDHVRRLPTDETYRMDVRALAEAIARDREEGRQPMAVVATAGTTSSNAVDPLGEIADLCEREDLWLHVDAAYAGNAAICPELREPLAGWERADSIVVNPYKWLFVPMDGSVLFVRDPDDLRTAFTLVPEYLKTEESDAVNLMDFGFQLGRRFRALKVWMVLRSLGAEGLRSVIRGHVALARQLARRVDEHPGFERMVPVPFATVCLRVRLEGASAEEEDRFNERLMAEVNADGSVFLSHTRLGDRYVIRVVFGHYRASERQLDQVWKLLTETAQRLREGEP